MSDEFDLIDFGDGVFSRRRRRGDGGAGGAIVLLLLLLPFTLWHDCRTIDCSDHPCPTGLSGKLVDRQCLCVQRPVTE